MKRCTKSETRLLKLRKTYFAASLRALARVHEARGEDAKRIVEICDRAINAGRTHMVKRVQAVRARVAKRANLKLESSKKSSDIIENETLVSAELLQLSDEEISKAEKKKLLTSSVGKLEGVSNREDVSDLGRSPFEIAEHAKRAFDKRCIH